MLLQGEYEAALTIYDNHVSRGLFFFTENVLKTMIHAFFILYEIETYHSVPYMYIYCLHPLLQFFRETVSQQFWVRFPKDLHVIYSSSVSYTCAWKSYNGTVGPVFHSVRVSHSCFLKGCKNNFLIKSSYLYKELILHVRY